MGVWGVNRWRGQPFNVAWFLALAQGLYWDMYRGTSLMRIGLPAGLFSSPMPRALWWF